MPMTIADPLVSVLVDPNVAYLLFILGIIGLVGEFHHPGTLFPGIVGAVALVLALVGFSALGVNWIGVDSANMGRHNPFAAIEGVGDGPRIVLWHEPDPVDELPNGPAPRRE